MPGSRYHRLALLICMLLSGCGVPVAHDQGIITPPVTATVPEATLTPELASSPIPSAIPLSTAPPPTTMTTPTAVASISSMVQPSPTPIVWSTADQIVLPTVTSKEQIEALPNYGTTTYHFSEITNTEARLRFFNAYLTGRPGRWEWIGYTLEGGTVSNHVLYHGQGTAVRVIRDATNDGWAGWPTRSEYTCSALTENQGQLQAEGCTTPHRPGKVLTYPLPSAPVPVSIDELAGDADVIIIGAVASVVAQGSFAGYDEGGNLLHTTDPNLAHADLAFTDYAMTVEQVLLDDGALQAGKPLVVRIVEQSTNAAQPSARQTPYLPLSSIGDRHLWLLSRNPDQQTYGLRYGPWSRLVVDGPIVVLSDGQQTPVKIAGSTLTPADFDQRLRDTLALRGTDVVPNNTEFSFPTLTPAPTEPPPTTVQAAIEDVLEGRGMLPVTALEVRVTQPVTGGLALLMTYNAQRDDQAIAVTEFLYLDQRGPVWYPDGNSYDVRAGAESTPVQFLYGSYVIGNDRDRCTFAGGLVTDPAVRRVAVTFDDGSQQVVTVTDSAYLAVQLGVTQVTRIEALDDQGQVLYQHMPE